MKFYNYELDRRVLPALALIQITRAQIESLLSQLRQKGHASGTLRGVRATVSTILRAAVERGYLNKNSAHGIRIRATSPRAERRWYSPAQVCQLLTQLSEPCHTVVQLAVLAGMRIGEILALRWKRVDLLRGTIEVAENYCNGEFGTPKTRSSCRVLPLSTHLCAVLEGHRKNSKRTASDDLVFCTEKGAPLNQKNLYNRELALACDRIKLPRVSWHSFRHTHATLLTEVGESIKTTQALLGHSDLGTTLNTYSHVIPQSQRRAVEKVSGVMFSDVLKLDENPACGQIQ